MHDIERTVRYLSIAIHDVSPSTVAASRQLIDLVMKIAPGAPLTLLVVPFHHGWRRIDTSSDTRRLIDARVAAGDEVALHGFWHRDDAAPPRSVGDWLARRVLTDGEAEFASLDYGRADQLLAQGHDLLHACGWQSAGFVPPAWQLSTGARQALQRYPFSYVTSRNYIESLANAQIRLAPALSFSARSLARRRLSMQWCRLWLAKYSALPFLRVALHPADAAHPSLLRSWSQVIEFLLHERCPVTKGGWLRLQSVDQQRAMPDAAH
jgi:predicted deacetylase